MARTKFRSRARARSATRRARPTTRTSTSTLSARSGDSWTKYILPAAAVGIVAYLLWPKTALAGEKGKTNGGGVDIKPPPPPPPPPPNRFPAGAILAVIQSPGPFDPGTAPGMRLRASPTTNSAIVHAGVPNGTDVQLLRKDIAEQGIADTPGKNRWAEVRTLEGVQGFLRAIGPNGEPNIVIRVGPNTGALTGAFAPFHPQQLRLHPVHSHPVRRQTPPGWRGW